MAVTLRSLRSRVSGREQLGRSGVRWRVAAALSGSTVPGCRARRATLA